MAFRTPSPFPYTVFSEFEAAILNDYFLMSIARMNIKLLEAIEVCLADILNAGNLRNF